MRLGCRRAQSVRACRAVASMRPRRVRLGCEAARRGRTPASARFNEAEARTPRMLRRQTLATRGGCRASMRPRRARLGCARRRDAADADLPASMRPRRVRLGCEAVGNRRPWTRRSFNEAEARTPRMQADRPDSMPGPRPASMRPRRARLGCVDMAVVIQRICRRFNEAEARTPRMHGSARQCRVGRRASMRPRRVRLGCSRPITRWRSRRSRRAFERWSVAADGTGPISVRRRIHHVKEPCDSNR